jgi:hypothetical protein
MLLSELKNKYQNGEISEEIVLSILLKVKTEKRNIESKAIQGIVFAIKRYNKLNKIILKLERILGV